MKKILLTLAVVIFCAAGVNAQINFGLKAGMTAANMKASGGGITVSMDTKIGFYAGALAEIGVSENFSVQPELFYSLLGSKMNFEGISAKDDLSYINLPILAKYRKDGFSLFLGPQVSYLVAAKEKISGADFEDDENGDIKDEMKSIDFSGVIGAGYTLANGFGFDARYQLGLSNNYKNNEDGMTLKNSAFLVGIHYKF